MRDEIIRLMEIKTRFQSYIKEPRMMYTYIAPKQKQLFDKFFSIAAEQPTLSSSMYEVLSKNELTNAILIKYFSQTTDLEIYIASNDAYSSVMFNGTLREYIESNNIQFDY